MQKIIASQQPFITNQYEYLLVANPDDTVVNRLKNERQFFYERYKEDGAIATKPYIKVVNFLAAESMEETVIRWIERISSRQHSFSVVLNNYSGFPPHTIYVRVQNPQPFQQLAKQLKVISDYIKNNESPLPNISQNPHLPIARRLPEDVYSKAMMDYSQRDFHSSFMVNELVLLKRKHQLDACEKVMVFRFLPTQPDLLTVTA